MRKIPPNKHRRKNLGLWSSTEADGMNGAFSIPLRPGVLANCIVSNGIGIGGELLVPWEHVSVHIEDRKGQRTPTWNEMCQVKDLFWEPEECVVQFHPPKSEYVNNHPNVLHLWKHMGDFPTPPSVLVGIKDLGEMK